MTRRYALLAVPIVLAGCSKHESAPAPASSAAQVASAPAPAVASQEPAQASASAAAAPEETASAAPVEPMTAARRARILAGIQGFTGMIRQRMAIGTESDDACDARTTAQGPRWEALKKQVGQDWLDRETRYSSAPPNLHSSVEMFFAVCMGCTSEEDDEKVPHECKQALVAFDDLAAQVRAAK